ncbi:MAG: hypothetical protein U1F34_03730 [Gammaproteobacteria bacterium]
MSKLYKLKEWFSLEDAARRLSSGLDEPVSRDDVVQLVIEGHLPMSWFARHVPAEEVAKRCFLHHLMPPIIKQDECPRDYIGPVIWHGDYAYRTHVGAIDGDALRPYASLSWGSIHENQMVEYIEGVYRLELDECGALKDWVHSLLTNTGGELITLDGFFVSDAEGTMWRILEHNPGGEYQAPDGTVKKLKPSYHPSGVFPDAAELVIRRADIEAFEASVAQGEQATGQETGSRERQTLLNVLAGLLGLMLGKTPAGKPQSVYESQAAIIEALLAHYQGKSGISKRTLEEKFAQAKRGFNAD